MTAPPIMSLKPERYLVAEYRHRSAPSLSGCWNVGPSSVLSTITTGLGFRRPAAATASRMSVIMMVGFAGVSIRTMARFLAERMASSRSPDASGRHRNTSDVQRAEKILDQMLRAAVNRDGIDDAFARPREGEQRGHDGGHPGVEYQRSLCARFERNQVRSSRISALG